MSINRRNYLNKNKKVVWDNVINVNYENFPISYGYFVFIFTKNFYSIVGDISWDLHSWIGNIGVGVVFTSLVVSAIKNHNLLGFHWFFHSISSMCFLKSVEPVFSKDLLNKPIWPKLRRLEWKWSGNQK